METALEHLSKEDLIKVISSRDGIIQSQSKDSSAKDEKIEYLESQIPMYKRMQFGQKRERFEGDISKAIAKAGHDTELDKASTATYEALPSCCLYDRNL